MEKRYQVFVSSTYADLVAERGEVIQALLELECMPSGMELFPAATETQWDWIKRVIDESDYYLVIVAGRYGSVSKESGLSYTEMEYRYAVETGKPVIGFVHEDPSSLPVKFSESTDKKCAQLAAFRDLVMNRLCKMYANPSDLGAKVSRSVTQLKKQHPAVGWVRADGLGSPMSAAEILRLREENEQLETQLMAVSMAPSATAERLASGGDPVDLAYSFTRRVRNEKQTGWKNLCVQTKTVQMSWDAILAAIAPALVDSAQSRWLRSCLSKAIWPEVNQELAAKYPDERFTDVVVASADWDTVLLQFRALNILQRVEGGWKLTGYGDKYVIGLLAVPKGETRPRPLPK